MENAQTDAKHTLSEKSEARFRWDEPPQTREELTELLKESPLLYNSYRRLNRDWQQRFQDFCLGKKSLPLTYDPFFKRIFDPDIHPERLSDLISSLLGFQVRIVHILPREDSMLDGFSLLIMDLLGELEDGSLVNVEIQKQGYFFPAERISCYSSDMIMRQYARVKGNRGADFTYRDIKKAYAIVLFEESTSAFHEIPDHYVHYGKTTFQTGLKMELLQEFCFVSLDVFRNFPYPKSRNKQTAWLSLLITESLEDAEALIADYPWMEEIYQEIAMLRQNPREVLEMFSEALKILDQNTIKYMIDDMKATIQEKDAALMEKDAILLEKDDALMKKDSALLKKDAEIALLKEQLAKFSKQQA